MLMNTAMILAAGRGERMRPLTDTTPKPLLTVQGKPLIEHHLERLAGAGFSRVVINHAWLGEQIEAHLGDGGRFGLQILYSAEQTALETAGGIVHALPLLMQDNPSQQCLVVNGDIFCDIPFSLESPLHARDKAHLMLVDNPAHNPAGDFALQGARVVPDAQPKYTFSGVAAYPLAEFAELAPGHTALAPILRRWIAQGVVGGHKHTGFWHDIGTPERLAQINRGTIA